MMSSPTFWAFGHWDDWAVSWRGDPETPVLCSHGGSGFSLAPRIQIWASNTPKGLRTSDLYMKMAFLVFLGGVFNQDFSRERWDFLERVGGLCLLKDSQRTTLPFRLWGLKMALWKHIFKEAMMISYFIFSFFFSSSGSETADLYLGMAMLGSLQPWRSGLLFCSLCP